VANSTQVPEKFTRRDSCFLLRILRAVFLQRSVKIKLALLPEQQRRDGGDGLGDGREPIERVRSCPHRVLEIRAAESSRPFCHSIFDDGNRHSRSAVGSHEALNRRFQPHTLFKRNLSWLRKSGDQQKQQRDREKRRNSPNANCRPPSERSSHGGGIYLTSPQSEPRYLELMVRSMFMA
jgi:hypothetical protein